MPISAVVPGNFVSITPDVLTSLPASYTFTPSPTMLVVSANMQALTLQMASNDKYLNDTKVALVALASQAALTPGAALVGVRGNVGTTFTFTSRTLQSFADWLSDNFYTATSYGDTTDPTLGSALIGIDAYTGTQYAIAAGPIRTFLRDVAAKGARVEKAQTFTNTQTFADALVIADGGYVDREVSTISASATTLLVNGSHFEYRAELWNGAGNTLTVTMAFESSPGNPPVPDPREPEVVIEFHPMNVGWTVVFQDDAAPPNTLLTMADATVGAGFTCVWKWSRDTNRWRLRSPGPLSVATTTVTLTNP